MHHNAQPLVRPRLIPMITAMLLVGCAAGLTWVGYIALTARAATAEGQPSPRGLPIFGIAAVLILVGGLIGKLALSGPRESEQMDW